MKEAPDCSNIVAKYTGIIVLSDFSGETLFPLLVLRMNLFPTRRDRWQRLKTYTKSAADENSPVL